MYSFYLRLNDWWRVKSINSRSMEVHKQQCMKAPDSQQVPGLTVSVITCRKVIWTLCRGQKKVFPWCSLPCNFKYLNSLTATLTNPPRSLANFLTSRSLNRTSSVLSMSEVLIHKLHRVCQLNIRETQGEINNHSLVNLEVTYFRLNSCELPFWTCLWLYCLWFSAPCHCL